MDRGNKVHGILILFVQAPTCSQLTSSFWLWICTFNHCTSVSLLHFCTSFALTHISIYCTSSHCTSVHLLHFYTSFQSLHFCCTSFAHSVIALLHIFSADPSLVAPWVQKKSALGNKGVDFHSLLNVCIFYFYLL
jgi:hypothetical protein